MGKEILDVTCGSRMLWFDKNNPNTLYTDNRELDTILCDGRTLNVAPDQIEDFTDLSFENEMFNLVVFDPPHLKQVGDTSWLAKKYGKLGEGWEKEIELGFYECMRVLKHGGILIFKWNEDQIKLSELLKAIPYKPLFGNRNWGTKTHWLVFFKN